MKIHIAIFRTPFALEIQEIYWDNSESFDEFLINKIKNDLRKTRIFDNPMDGRQSASELTKSSVLGSQLLGYDSVNIEWLLYGYDADLLAESEIPEIKCKKHGALFLTQYNWILEVINSIYKN